MGIVCRGFKMSESAPCVILPNRKEIVISIWKCSIVIFIDRYRNALHIPVADIPDSKMVHQLPLGVIMPFTRPTGMIQKSGFDGPVLIVLIMILVPKICTPNSLSHNHDI